MIRSARTVFFMFITNPSLDSGQILFGQNLLYIYAEQDSCRCGGNKIGYRFRIINPHYSKKTGEYQSQRDKEYHLAEHGNKKGYSGLSQRKEGRLDPILQTEKQHPEKEYGHNPRYQSNQFLIICKQGRIYAGKQHSRQVGGEGNSK